MRRRHLLLGLLAASAAAPLWGSEAEDIFRFAAIEGGTLDLTDFRGGPVLVVNTASRCGFTGQYDGLQALYDRYRGRGLTVVGVPSRSFGQELASDGEVKNFCEVNFAINFPMTGLVEVTGPNAHPFYAWARAQGVAPMWNFHKILLDGEGRIAADFGALTGPELAKLILAIEALLPEARG